jgi:UDP-N-acetylglucosamine 4-epimerase
MHTATAGTAQLGQPSASPVYRHFRARDVRHSLADIGKAATRLGYAPTQRIGQGLALAMPWYIAQEQV